MDSNKNPLCSDIEDYKCSIFQLLEQVSKHNRVIRALEIGIAERDEQLKMVSEKLMMANEKLMMANEQLKTADEQYAALSQQISQLHINLEDRDRKIDEMKQSIYWLQEANIHAQIVEREIADMQRSIIWKSVNKFHNVIIENTCPQYTKRREFYDLFLKGSRIIVNDGWSIFWLKFKGYRNDKKVPKKGIYFLPESNQLNISMPDELNKLEVKVSIAIPTKNAGPDFVYTMEKIRCQKGIDEIEVIIVDSGSSDETIDIAKKYGANVYEIDPEEFGHGKTRNYAASKATGDYIIFTVQDAIPIGDHWLYDLVRVLCDRDDIAAATCRQVPRSDADLFAKISIWSHHEYLEPDSDTVFEIKEEALEEISAAELRRAAGLNNVCNCIKRDVFDKFKFNEISYAEDLDLGVRLLKENYKTCFLASAGVIHSHNRDHMYHLGRSYVDAKSLAIILNEAPSDQYKDLDAVLCELVSLYDSLKYSANLLNLKHETRAEMIFSEIKYNLFKENKYDIPIEYTNIELDKILCDFRELIKYNLTNRRTIYREYIYLLDRYAEYLEITAQSCDNLESFDLIFKLFAVYCGISLGRSSYYNSDDERIKYINSVLSKGI